MTPDLYPPPAHGIRQERIVACFLESMPSDDEIDRARRRFRHTRVARRGFATKALLITALQGLVIGLASAATAAFIADRLMPSAPSEPTQSPGEPADSNAPLERVGEHARRPRPAEVWPGPPPSAAFDEVERAPAAAPIGTSAESSAKPSASPETRARARKVSPPSVRELIHTAPAKASGPAVGVLPQPSPATVGSWERAAKALEARNWGAADRALDDLDDSDDAHTRDAAALARAQLWITQGRGADARATLERLAVRGHTPLIRRRAADLLGQL